MALAVEDINWQKFPSLFDLFLRDVITIRQLGPFTTFIDNFNMLLASRENEKVVFDEQNYAVCKYPIEAYLPPVTEESSPTPIVDTREEILRLSERIEQEIEDDLVENFYNFNLTDFILALTSLVITVIAVANSVYLIYTNKCRPKSKVKRNEIEIKEEEEEREEIKTVKTRSILRKPRQKKIYTNNVTFSDEICDPPPQKTFWEKIRRKSLRHSIESPAESPRPVRRDSV